MGYWAINGSYQYDEKDLKTKEAMNETQGQAYKRQQAGITAATRYEKEQKRNEQLRKEWEANSKAEEIEIQKNNAKNMQKYYSKVQKEQERWQNLQQYGVEFNLRNPKELEDRRSRANYWRTQNKFYILLNAVNGKSKKFNDLWVKYSISKSEEERLQIIEEMERMFPTKESAIRRAEKNARGGR